MREARASLFKAQEARRQAALRDRANAAAGARKRMQVQIQAAKKEIENDKEAAKAALQAEAGTLAREIVRRVLAPAGAGQ